MDLFSQAAKEAMATSTPLAERIRPQTIADFAGQEHLLADGKPLRAALTTGEFSSMILWGPPGTGKTTLARLLAKSMKAEFYMLSAVGSGVSEVRNILQKAANNRRVGNRSVLFIDEIHRFNKAQQDALLHRVEDGTILLIGATTENPSFEVIAPLLSRCQVYTLKALSEEALMNLLDRALQADRQLAGAKIELTEQARHALVQLAGGDARAVLNGLELAAKLVQPGAGGKRLIDVDDIREAVQKKAILYDRAGDQHYDTISAFIKSVRGSDPNAALHYLARMIEAGEDPKFIARRLIILASEDIGNADPMALVLASSAFTAVTYIGMPEASLVLSQATTYLAAAPKSNAAYVAISEARQDVRDKKLEPVPLHLRNAPTKLMAREGYSEGYRYPHDHSGNFVDQNYLPENVKNQIYYRPTHNGAEAAILQRLKNWWAKYRRSGA